MSYSASSRCLMCYRPGTLQCRLCPGTEAKYCSDECRTDNFPLHELLCYRASTISPKPLDTSCKKQVLGFLLPLYREQPELIWLACEVGQDGEMNPWVGVERHIGAGHTYLMGLDRNNLQGALKLSRRLGILYNSSMLEPVIPSGSLGAVVDCKSIAVQQNDGNKVQQENKCVRRITAGRSVPYRWTSAMVVLHLAQSEPVFKYADIDVSDLRHVADFFAVHQDEKYGNGLTTYSAEDAMDPPEDPSTTPMVRGIRINGASSVEMLGRDTYMAWNVDADHVIFKNCPTDISSHIGIPIVITKLPANYGLWRLQLTNDPNSTAEAKNIEATAMNVSMEPTYNQYGLSKIGWRSDVGDAVVVRKDGKPLLVEHVEALADYCRTKIDGDMAEARNLINVLGKGKRQSIITEMERVNDGINRTDFRKFWEVAKRTERWNVVSPFVI